MLPLSSDTNDPPPPPPESSDSPPPTHSKKSNDFHDSNDPKGKLHLCKKQKQKPAER